MSQISPPVRVLLVLSVMFMAAWMTILKPSEEVVPAADVPAATAAQTAPGQQVSAAKDAVAGADARNGQAEVAADGVTDGSSAAAATGSVPATASTTGAAAPGKSEAVKAGEAGGLPLSVLKGIADRKVVVLLFWNSNASDDRAVRRELKGIDRHDGKVVVEVAPLGKVAGYQQITRGANVDQSPTVVVVDRNRQVQTLTGFSDRQTIDQAISDALRAK